jgi:hypothetical protein
MSEPVDPRSLAVGITIDAQELLPLLRGPGQEPMRSVQAAELTERIARRATLLAELTTATAATGRSPIT